MTLRPAGVPLLDRRMLKRTRKAGRRNGSASRMQETEIMYLVARCRDDGFDPACPELLRSPLGAERRQTAETAGAGLERCRPAVHG